MGPQEYVEWLLEVAVHQPIAWLPDDSPLRELAAYASGGGDALDLSPRALEALERLEAVVESGEVVAYGARLSELPHLELKPSKKNPRVKRWQRTSKDAGKTVRVAVEEGVSGDAPASAEDIYEQLASSRHVGALKWVANTKLQIKGGRLAAAAMATPYYDPDRNLIAVHEDHLKPEWYRSKGVKTPDQVIVHELAHAWDYGLAAERGHPGKSYWVSEVAPKIAKATPEPPEWFWHPEFARVGRAMDMSEWPAVLTEMLFEPEKFEAVRRWYADRGVDLGEELNAFYGVPVAPRKVDEKKVAKLLEAMDGFRGGKRGRWRVPWKGIAYAGAAVFEDPGFIDLDDLPYFGDPYEVGEYEEPEEAIIGLEEEESNGEERDGG